MAYFAFLLVILVMIDHFLKHKRHGLLYYKNDHVFSIVIALTTQHLTLDELIDLARKSKHECIFVNVNDAINKDDFPDLTIIDLKVDATDFEDLGRTKYLAHAYHEGMKHTHHDFLLFMDDQLYFEPKKAVSHLANNLVEHQLFTGKEVLETRRLSQGYLIFFDLFRDMNYPYDKINYSFYAIKKETYELSGADQIIPESVEAFETLIERKNIRIHHINHGKTLFKRTLDLPFKLNIKHYLLQMRVKERLLGQKRLMLYLFALHVFYILMVVDFQLINLAFIALVHMGVYLSVKNYTKHHPISYVFIPIYMLLFDFVFLQGLWKRRRYHKRILKQGGTDNETIQSSTEENQ